jgi:uncharacterized protein (TIGR00251 family)
MRIETRQGAVRFTVHAQPRASRTELIGWHGDAVKIRVAAPPVEGAANAELIALLAKKLGVPKSAVRILKGERGRRKLVEVKGVAAEYAMARLSRPS